MYFTPFNLSPNRLLNSQQHLHSLLLSPMFEEYLYLDNAQTTSHNIMSRTNREQSSRAMATTVMKFKGKFKNIWAPPQKKSKYFIFR